MTKGKVGSVLLTKSFVSDVVEADLTSRKAVFTISTAAVDRQMDTIDVKGWDTEAYLKNPVLLWAHDQDALPIGRVTGLSVTDTALKAEVEFCTADVNPLGEQVHQGVLKGFIKATSVGFQPLEYEIAEDRPGLGRMPPVNFTKQALLELSLVNVPANPGALIDDISSEQTTVPLRSVQHLVAKAKRARKIRSLLLSN